VPRWRKTCRLRWHLHDIDPDFAATIPARKLNLRKWNAMVVAFLRERAGGVAVSICLDLAERIKDLGDRAGRLERELEERVKVEAPQLLELPGCGPMSAARIVAGTGDPASFKSAAASAMFTGCAPIPASSGNSQRVRLNRGGNRRMNAALHRIAITQKRMHPTAQDDLAIRPAMGNSNTKAIRSLKRYLARRVFTLLSGGAPAVQVTSLAAERAAPIAA
jgi:Transposase IS116/IS110/IS902 family.